MIVSSYWPSQAPYEEIPLYELLRRSASTQRDKTAVIGADGSTRTYARIWSDARKVARLLQDNGVEKGGMVGIFSPNHIDYPAVFYGSLLAGATVTTLNPLYTPHEIEHQLSDAGATILFAFSFMRPAAEEAKKNLPLLRSNLHHRLTAGGAGGRLRGIQAGHDQPQRGRRRASLLQRHHRPTQGSHAHSLQHHLQRQARARDQRDTAGHDRPLVAPLIPQLWHDGAHEQWHRDRQHWRCHAALRRRGDDASSSRPTR